MDRIKLKFHKLLKAKSYYLPAGRHGLKADSGFTLIELLVAVGVFSIVVGISTNMFINAIKTQRKALVVQNVTDNARHVMEILSREIRVARADNNLVVNPEDISFTSNSEHRQGQIVKFSFDVATGNVTFDDDINSGDVARNITAGVNVKVTALNFTIDNASGQPKITVALSAQAKNPGAAANTIINLQTTISPREINL